MRINIPTGKKNTVMVAIQISVTRGNGLRPLVVYKWICTCMGSNLKEIEMYYRAQWKGGYYKWVINLCRGERRE